MIRPGGVLILSDCSSVVFALIKNKGILIYFTIIKTTLFNTLIRRGWKIWQRPLEKYVLKHQNELWFKKKSIIIYVFFSTHTVNNSKKCYHQLGIRFLTWLVDWTFFMQLMKISLTWRTLNRSLKFTIELCH